MPEAIVVSEVVKNFTIRYHRTIKQMSVAKVRREEVSRTFRAVDEVSFTISQGESVALMGLNGSGKSTLMKLISGVMKPDAGKVRTRGRIAGLIATGTGFHPQLTGRDNIFLNAAILGMGEAETLRKFDDIVEFADLGKHLDGQVGHYSSGQVARLGFAVAINVDSDIFLADEALAVGTGRSSASARPSSRRSAPRGGRWCSSVTRRAPCGSCARARSCWRRAGSASTGRSPRGSTTSSTTTRTATTTMTTSAPTSDRHPCDGSALITPV